jgi:hypothetical protein
MAKKKAVKRTASSKAKPSKTRVKAKPAAKARRTPARAKRASAKGPSLGRPTVSLEEKLFLLFREDFHARQIFEFLRADTVRDLEQFSPEEIVKRLSQPIRQSVQRIRLKLARHNRCLRDDQEFALEHADDEQPT